MLCHLKQTLIRFRAKIEYHSLNKTLAVEANLPVSLLQDISTVV